MQQVNDVTFKMVQKNKTGMVSPPKEASKFIMNVVDPESGALMASWMIAENELNAMLERNKKGLKPLNFNSEEATRREFARKY